MRVDIIHCDMCGKQFDEFDRQESFGFHYPDVGYGSKFDNTSINIDLCCDCFDKMMDNLIPKLQYDITEYVKSVR